MLQGGTHDRAGFTRAELDSFADNLAEPARSRACVAVYRTFVLREQLALVRGRYADTRLRTPHPPHARRLRSRHQARALAGYETTPTR